MTTQPIQYDYTVIGGGIVGLSTALQLQRAEPLAAILLIEKEPTLATHQTGHNSGVIHAGVYYAPGSLKADFCKRGARDMMDFCRQQGIPFRQPGKLLVATSPLELQRLSALQQRCGENGIDCEPLDAAGLRKLEPRVDGLAALLVADSGIVDYIAVADAMAREFRARGGRVLTNCKLLAVSHTPAGLALACSHTTINTGFAISCAGLAADRICDLFGVSRQFAIIPFRGEYYRLADSKRQWVQRLIYPVPDPAVPFLGVHLTPTIDGQLTVGPNAVLGWKREGYRPGVNFSLRDTLDMLRFRGFPPLLRQHFRSGCEELLNSWMKRRYLKQVQKYCPGIDLRDLLPYPAGVRAQAVSADGALVQDFLFAESRLSLHVCNAPSPAATSSLPIGEHIAARARHLRTGN